MASPNPFDSVDFLRLPFALHARALGLEHEQARTDGEEPRTLAFLLSAQQVTAQLATAEQALEASAGDLSRLAGLARSPWVLGYVFGAVAAALERNGVERTSPGAASALMTVHQLVLREPDTQACQRVADAVVSDPEWSAGVRRAVADATAGPEEPGSAAGLAEHLLARLALD